MGRAQRERRDIEREGRAVLVVAAMAATLLPILQRAPAMDFYARRERAAAIERQRALPHIRTIDDRKLEDYPRHRHGSNIFEGNTRARRCVIAAYCTPAAGDLDLSERRVTHRGG